MGHSGGVVVIGSMTADVTAKAHRLPKRGETVLGDEFTLVSGGKGSNQAVMAARMGVPTWMVGCVGDDAFQHVVIDSLTENNVSTTHIDVLAGEKTGIAHIRVDDSANNDIVIVPLANARTDKAKVDRYFEADVPANTLLLQLEIPLETAMYAAARAKEKGLTVVFDPAPAAEIPDEMYRLVDIVTPNETEASLLTGVDVVDIKTAEEAARVLKNKGVPTVIITLADKGVLILNNAGVMIAPTFKVRAIDTTAAGDAFTGALGACLAKGLALKESVRYAIAAGALAVTKMGAQSALPNLQEVESLLNRGEEQ